MLCEILGYSATQKEIIITPERVAVQAHKGNFAAAFDGRWYGTAIAPYVTALLLLRSGLEDGAGKSARGVGKEPS